MAKQKVTLNAPAPAPEPVAPAIDKAAEIKLLLPAVQSAFDAKGKLEGAKASLCALLFERIEDLGESADRQTIRDILTNAIATAKGVKPGKVSTPPAKDGSSSGGDPTLYSFLSEIMSICYGKEEHREKVKSEIAKGTAFDKLRFFARHGRATPKKRQEKEPEPYTADKLQDDLVKIALRARLAEIEWQTIRDTAEVAFDATEKTEKEPASS